MNRLLGAIHDVSLGLFDQGGDIRQIRIRGGKKEHLSLLSREGWGGSGPGLAVRYNYAKTNDKKEEHKPERCELRRGILVELARRVHQVALSF